MKWIRDIGVGCTWLYTPWMLMKGSSTRVRSHSSLCVLYIITIRLRWRWTMMTALIESDYVIICLRQLCDHWFFLVLVTFDTFSIILQSVDKDQQEMCAVAEKPHDVDHTVVKFDTYRNVQRHRAVLPAIARNLVFKSQEEHSKLNARTPYVDNLIRRTSSWPLPADHRCWRPSEVWDWSAELCQTGAMLCWLLTLVHLNVQTEPGPRRRRASVEWVSGQRFTCRSSNLRMFGATCSCVENTLQLSSSSVHQLVVERLATNACTIVAMKSSWNKRRILRNCCSWKKAFGAKRGNVLVQWQVYKLGMSN